ncbi:MAG: NAD(P)-dependent oxidoreductase, partial [Bacteroidota bacterium]
MNQLYPIFLKPDQFKILIVGGGFVAEEKLRFLLKSSPQAHVELVATFYRKPVQEIIRKKHFKALEKT